MYVPPAIYRDPNATVIKKTIVYSDTVLPLKDLGDNTKLTSIANVSESSLEDCLKIIFESNPNVVFNTIQYSKNAKKVYFYTNREITIKEYEESKIHKYKPITSSSAILEELKNILTVEINKDSNCVSLYDVAKLYRKTEREYLNVQNTASSNMQRKLRGKYDDSMAYIGGFDYVKNTLKIDFYLFNKFESVYFSKEDNDLYISKSETYHDKEILFLLGDELSYLYDELLKYEDYLIQFHYYFRPVNSNFLANISNYGVSIQTSMQDFRLSAYNWNNEYTYDCNSNVVLSEYKGNETEVLKRIFVKIEDCPEWSRQQLYEIRQNQLEQQKRLELKRKIFPWLKNK